MLLDEGKKLFVCMSSRKKIMHSDMLLFREKLYKYYYVEWLISK